MRKLLTIALAITLVSVAVSSARAEEGSELEISGNVTTVTGWQQSNDAVAFGTDGILGDGLRPAAGAGANDDTFGFFVDQAEIDLAKSFGENIRVRADLDFSPNRTLDTVGNVEIEQAYVTANLPAGNGVELLVGRFNSGIGLDPIDRNELSTVSFSNIHRTLLPFNVTGARLGYDFSETTRGEIYVVNDLQNAAPGSNTTSEIPSGGFNLIYSYGDEGQKNLVKLSGAVGPENPTSNDVSFIADLSAELAATEALSVGLEGTYRQDHVAVIADNAQFVGGQIKAKYAFSDVWDGTLRYSMVWDLDGTDVGAAALPAANTFAAAAPGLGINGQSHQISLATSYQITDGAKFVLEGNVDVARPSAGGTGYTPGVAGMFAYSF